MHRAVRIDGVFTLRPSHSMNLTVYCLPEMRTDGLDYQMIWHLILFMLNPIH